MTISRFEQALRYLYGFINFEVQPDLMAARPQPNRDLERYRHFLAQLGSPQRSFPVILVAGTNGKGSTSRALAAVFSAAGYRTGHYSSPHICTIRERFQIDGQPISEQRFVEGIDRLRPLLDAATSSGPDATGFRTVFETMTALAFLHFAEQQVDLAVIEVGLGGRLDSTNVCEPFLSVITSISLDHQEVLGPTLSHIAVEKAGIMRPGCPVVCAPQVPEVAAVLRQHAAECGARLALPDAAEALPLVGLASEGGGLRQTFRAGQSEVSSLLLGPHQRENLALALRVVDTARELGWKLPEEAVLRGLSTVTWPGRFDLLTLPGEGSEEPVVLCDGAHNIGGADALRASLDEVFPTRPRVFITSFSRGKEPYAMMERLLRPGDAWYLYLRPGARALPWEWFTEHLPGGRELPTRLSSLESWHEEIALPPGCVVCFCGSLLFLGQVLREFRGVELDPV